MAEDIVQDGALVQVDPYDKRLITFDWHTDNLPAGVAISTSYFTLKGVKPSALSIASITRLGTTATVTTAEAHGLSTGDTVAISGADQPDYNIAPTITVTTTTAFTFTVANSPTTPATGTIVYGTGLGLDNASILSDAEHDSRYTQVRVLGVNDTHVGKLFELSNRIITNSSPTEQKERSCFVLIRNMSEMG